MVKYAIAPMLLVALLSGSLLHATISHDHGHSHSASESATWSQLHSSLRHEDKSPIGIITENLVLSVIALVASFAAFAAIRSSHARAAIRDPFAREALRRGIYRYRVFV